MIKTKLRSRKLLSSINFRKIKISEEGTFLNLKLPKI